MRKMFRFVCLLLTMMCLLPALAEETGADAALRGYSQKSGYVYLTLGEYPQTAEGDSLPILWRVLAADGQKAYILSEYVLAAHRIHGDYQEYANKPTNQKKPGFDGDFAQTELSLYLNGEFAMGHFTDGERLLLLPDDALGMFFLVSDADLKNTDYGFGTNKSRKAWGTEYAKANGLFVYRAKYGKHSPYWTLTQASSDARHARCTKDEGEIGRINVITEDLGMRPACYLDLTKAVIASGSGTMEDPFVLAVSEPVAAEPVTPAAQEAPAASATPESTECSCVPEGETCDCCDCCACSRR